MKSNELNADGKSSIKTPKKRAKKPFFDINLFLYYSKDTNYIWNINSNINSIQMEEFKLIIDPNIIKDILIKRDKNSKFKENPNSKSISVFIYDTLKKNITKTKQNLSIFYVIETLNDEVIDNIHKTLLLINPLNNYYFNLITNEKKDIITENLKKKTEIFNNIYYFNN